jgi:hypothetical protein
VGVMIVTSYVTGGTARLLSAAAARSGAGVRTRTNGSGRYVGWSVLESII